MAWQTPKTDWAASDGVRDSDFNRIEGNILELHKTSILQSELIVFVDTSGSDATGTGAAGAPFQTITKALSIIPKNLNGNDAYIQIANGSYAETVIISDFVGNIILTSEGNGEVTLDALVIENCACNISIDVLNITDDGIQVRNGARVIANSNIAVTGSNIGIQVENGSFFSNPWEVAIDNASVAIRALYGSSVYIAAIYGQDNTTGLVSYQGSTIAYNQNSISNTDVLLVTGTGGRIYSGVQTDIPNY